jgi:hypothetical protein
MTDQTAGIISIVVGIVVGIGVGIYFLWTLKRQLATRKWPAVSGKVLESSILEDSDSFELYVKYNYTVGGKTYISERIAPNKYTYENPAASTLKQMIAPYPAGKTVIVYFDPQNPQNALLKNHDSMWVNIFFALFSLGFIVGGFGLMSQK